MILSARIKFLVRGVFFFAFFNALLPVVVLYAFFAPGTPFRDGMNEMFSFLWLALFLLTAAAGKYSVEQKKTSLKKIFLVLTILFGFIFLWISVCSRFQGSLWLCSTFLPPIFLAGMASGAFDKLTSERKKLHFLELSGIIAATTFLFFLGDKIPKLLLLYVTSSVIFFLVLEISICFFPSLKKIFQKILFVLFMATLLFVLLASFSLSFFLCGNHKPSSFSMENEFHRQIAVLSGLQPEKRALRILILSPSPDMPLIESIRTFPLTGKLVFLSLSAPEDPFQRLSRCPFNFDLILLLPPAPGTFSANRLYTPAFFLSLKNHLGTDGVLGVFVPEFSGAPYRKERLFEIRGIVASTLRKIFPKVRLAPGGTYLLLCGAENVTNDLTELNERAGKLLTNSNYLPEGLLLLLNTKEELDQRNRSFSESSVTAKNNKSFPPPLLGAFLRGTPEIDKTPMGAVLDFYKRAAVFWGGVIVLFWLLLRYFLSAGLEKKRACLTFENGLFGGTMFASVLLLLQLKTGMLYTEGWLLSAVFFFFSMWGLSSSEKGYSSGRGIYFLSVLLVPVVFGMFCVNFLFQEWIPFPAAAAVGFCLGYSAGEIRGKTSLLLFGFSIGILFFVLSIFPYYGFWFCMGALILTRIPGIVTKNMKKEFDFSRFQPKIQEKEF